MQLEELGPAIRKRRKDLKITQETLADLAGCSKPFVIAAEAGKPTLRLDKLFSLLRVLGLSIQIVDRDSRDTLETSEILKDIDTW